MRGYFQKLIAELTDKHNLFAELMMAWIAVMLTTLVVFAAITIFGG